MDSLREPEKLTDSNGTRSRWRIAVKRTPNETRRVPLRAQRGTPWPEGDKQAAREEVPNPSHRRLLVGGPIVRARAKMKTTGDDTWQIRTVLQTRWWRRPTPHLLSVGQPEPPYDETPRVGKAHALPNISTGTTRRDGRQVDEQIPSGEATPPEHALRIDGICRRSKNENRPPTDPNPKIQP